MLLRSLAQEHSLEYKEDKESDIFSLVDTEIRVEAENFTKYLTQLIISFKFTHNDPLPFIPTIALSTFNR